MRKITDDNGNGFGWGYVPGRIRPALYTIKNGRLRTVAFFTGAAGLLNFDMEMGRLFDSVPVDRTDIDRCPKAYEGMRYDADRCAPDYCEECQELYYKGEHHHVDH